MRQNINIKRSIESGRLISNSFFHKFQGIANPLFIAFVSITIIIGPIKGVELEMTTSKIVLIGLALILITLGKLIALNMGKLTLINKQKMIIDRDFFNQMSENNDWAIVKEEENVVIFQTISWLSHERQVSILIENGFYYVNVMSFGNYDIISPVYLKKDKQILKKVIEEITHYNKG